METKKLFYDDPFLKEFTARVLSCEKLDGLWTVVLDRTAFYPEGGGQPADHGTLNGIPVTDVHEKDGIILHTCAAELECGAEVSGRLDWNRRFDHMQQHSGEHILSGILCELYHCDNVGFHLGADTVTIDYNTEITPEQVLAAEEKANQCIYADTPCLIRWPSAEELSDIPYRSKKELTGAVRIVTFPQADCCACCGTHVLRAGQVGLIKVLSCQKFRNGVRLEIVCGGRAFRYLSSVYEQDHTVAQLLSVKPDTTAAAVERLAAENTALKARCAELETQVFDSIANALNGHGDVLLLQPELRPDAARRLADIVARRSGGLAAVFAGADGHYSYALVSAVGMDISAFVKEMNAALCGRGGGRNGFAQGSAACTAEDLCRFFSERHPMEVIR